MNFSARKIGLAFLLIVSSSMILMMTADFLNMKVFYFSSRDFFNTKKPTPTKPKLILIYTNHYDKKHWWEDTRKQYGIEECAVSQCIITHNKSRYDASDAVLFHARDLPKDRTALKELRRSSSKLWIWYINESPKHLYHSPIDDDDLFNWTATYKTASQVYLPYGILENLTDSDPKPLPKKNFAEGKNKLMMIMVSNCREDRIEMVRKISNKIPIDVYGQCADYFDPELKDKCLPGECDKLISTYKFYLAFENSYCTEYVTEKYFENALMKGLVPLVVTKADLTDTRLAPANSTINLLDFKNLSELATYLNYLDKNDTAYNEYHQWRYTQIVRQQHSICEICKQLWARDNAHINDNGKQDKQSTTVKISNFWDVDNDCLSLGRVIYRYFSKDRETRTMN